MQYMLLITAPMSAEEEIAEHGEAYNKAMAAMGPVTTDGHALRPADTATTIRVRDGEVLATDGPFIEAKEQLTGYVVIDVEDLDAAVEYAATIPAAAYGAVEVRPVLPMG